MNSDLYAELICIQESNILNRNALTQVHRGPVLEVRTDHGDSGSITWIEGKGSGGAARNYRCQPTTRGLDIDSHCRGIAYIFSIICFVGKGHLRARLNKGLAPLTAACNPRPDIKAAINDLRAFD